MKKKVYSLIGALLLYSATAAAAPSVAGPTGMIDTPTADTLRPGQFSVGYYHLGSGVGSGSVNFNLANNFEMGVAGTFYNGGNSTSLHAKYSILPETVATPGFAVGIDGLAGDGDSSLYAVASKALPAGFRLSAGVGGGRFNGLFGSLEKTINPVSVVTGKNAFPATTLICEYDGHNINYGARMALVPGLKFDLGMRGGGSKQSYFGLTYTN